MEPEFADTGTINDVIEKISEEAEKKPKQTKELSATTDLVRAYLQEVRKIPLLSLQEEIEYTNAVVAGREAEKQLVEELDVDRELLHTFLLQKAVDIEPIRSSIAAILNKHSQQEINELEKKLKPKNLTKRQKILLNKAIIGISARKNLIVANSRLVVAIAKKYFHQGIDLSDLIQEGNLGLMKAVEKFDPSRGFKFSTYATWWIRQSVSRAIADQSRTIRLPVHIVETLQKMGRVVANLQQELHRRPTPTEIAQHMENPQKWSPRKVEEMLLLLYQPVSLDAPVGDNTTTREITIGDLIENSNAQRPVEGSELNQLHELLEEHLATLTELEQHILRARHGLLDGRKHTLEEIGAFAGVTRERIRQVEAKALRKLKASALKSGKLAGTL